MRSRSINICVQLKLRPSIKELRNAARSCSLAFSGWSKKRSRSARSACNSSILRLVASDWARKRASTFRTEYTCQPKARNTIPATAATKPATTMKRRCVSCALVARLSRTLMCQKTPNYFQIPRAVVFNRGAWPNRPNLPVHALQEVEHRRARARRKPRNAARNLFRSEILHRRAAQIRVSGSQVP